MNLLIAWGWEGIGVVTLVALWVVLGLVFGE